MPTHGSCSEQRGALPAQRVPTYLSCRLLVLLCNGLDHGVVHQVHTPTRENNAGAVRPNLCTSFFENKTFSKMETLDLLLSDHDTCSVWEI